MDILLIIALTSSLVLFVILLTISIYLCLRCQKSYDTLDETVINLPTKTMPNNVPTHFYSIINFKN